MQKTKSSTFHVYRYQILPISQQLQLDYLPGNVSSIKELVSKKNLFFHKGLNNIKAFHYPRTELNFKKILDDDQYFILQLGAKRSLNRSTREFKAERLDNWPFAWIIINNDSSIQKIAIQLNRKVFGDTLTVAKILEENIDMHLAPFQLKVHIEKMFEEREFWALVNKYRNKIIQAEFSIISPNLANISDALTIDFKRLHKDTNTQKTKIELNSDKEASLTLTPKDPLVEGLVKYSSQGGGNVSLKVRGLKKRLHTNDSVREITINDIELENLSPNEASKILKDILK